MKQTSAVYQLFKSRLAIVNIGLENLVEHLADFPVDIIQVDWRPPASAKMNLLKKIQVLKAKQPSEEGR
ncbi:MAG: hypothetical protein AB1427_11510 [Thermodesulfobacteriota bacterium]